MIAIGDGKYITFVLYGLYELCNGVCDCHPHEGLGG